MLVIITKFLSVFIHIDLVCNETEFQGLEIFWDYPTGCTFPVINRSALILIYAAVCLLSIAIRNVNAPFLLLLTVSHIDLFCFFCSGKNSQTELYSFSFPFIFIKAMFVMNIYLHIHPFLFYSRFPSKFLKFA